MVNADAVEFCLTNFIGGANFVGVPHKTIADRLRTLRGYAVPKLSARELAKFASIAPSHVGLIEAGGRWRISAQTVWRLAGAFGTTMDWLFAGAGVGPAAAAVRVRIDEARRIARKEV